MATLDQKRDQLRALLAEKASEVAAKEVTEDASLSDTAPDGPHGVVVPIREGIAKPHLVWIAGGGAGVPTCRRVAEHLPADQSIVGLQWHNLGPTAPETRSVAQLAALHVRALLAEYPAGPFCLCGHSLGGTVAVEMAQQLATEGVEVSGVCVIDQAGTNASASWRQWLFWQWAAVAQLPARQRWFYLREAVRFRLRSNRYLPRWMKRRFGGRETRAATDVKGRASLSANEFRMQMLDATLAALSDYVPAQFETPFTLIRAESGAPRIRSDAHGGWRNIAVGPLQVLDVRGHHMNMFDPDKLPQLAECLVAALEFSRR